MKALLKRIGGGLLFASVGTLMAGAMGGLAGGFGTVMAYCASDGDLTKYYNYDKVQEIVETNAAEELADLDEARENGDISDGEYLEMKENLEKKSHTSELKEKAVNEVFGNDEQFNGLVKRMDQLKKSYISLFSIFGASALCLGVGYLSDLTFQTYKKGFELLGEAREISDEKKKVKKEKQYEKELQTYTEEVERE